MEEFKFGAFLDLSKHGLNENFGNIEMKREERMSDLDIQKKANEKLKILSDKKFPATNDFIGKMLRELHSLADIRIPKACETPIVFIDPKIYEDLKNKGPQ